MTGKYCWNTVNYRGSDFGGFSASKPAKLCLGKIRILLRYKKPLNINFGLKYANFQPPH